MLDNPLANPDHNVAGNWRSSATIHGSPGGLDYSPFTGSPTADTDGDGIPDIVEYATGSGAMSGSEANLPVIGLAISRRRRGVGTYRTFSFVRDLAAGNVLIKPEVSSDLVTWQDGSTAMNYAGSYNNGNGTETVVWRSNQPTYALPPFIFARLAVSPR